MATAVLSGEADRRLRQATRQVIESGAATSFHVNLHRAATRTFLDATRIALPGPTVCATKPAVSFLISPTAFFQTNVRAAGLLAHLVVNAIPHPARVLDLYAGAGLFALPLARAGSQVVAVEESREAGSGSVCLMPPGSFPIRHTSRRWSPCAAAELGANATVEFSRTNGLEPS
jgi:tRNA/tmRNA/rRNA uracil-C5-methylase (TrmA/RlmC/RlmD family)